MMKRSDGMRIAFASLIENPLRTFLTLLGIAVGVTAVILVVSVIEGLNGYIGDKVAELGSDVFYVDRFGILLSHNDWIRAQRRNKRIEMPDVEAVRRRVTLAKRVGYMSQKRGPVRHKSKETSDIEVQGVSYEVTQIDSREIDAGRTFSRGEIESAAAVCCLGWGVADKLFGDRDPLGKKVSIWGRSFRVIGVAKKQGSFLGNQQDNFVTTPITTFVKIRGARRSYTVLVQARDPALLQETIDEVRSILRARRHLRVEDEDTFGIVTSDALMKVWHDMTRTIFSVATFVVSISLVVGGIVIMNIMLLSVVERTREIGVRKAVGARQRDIRFQFLVESGMLCAAGGIAGVALGWTLAWIVRTATPLPARFPLWAPILAVAVTSAVGLFFGLHPARKAASLHPIEALGREE